MNEAKLSEAVAQMEVAEKEYLKARIQLRQACAQLHEQGYSGYQLAKLTGLTKMTIYKWVKDATC